MNIGFYWMAALSAVFAALLLSAPAVSDAADAPAWSPGFPRMVEKNILLQWDPVKGASEYKVYRTETKDKDLKLLATVKANRHIDKDIPAGKTFYYYVTAVVDGAETPRSTAWSVTTKKEKVFVPLKKPTIAGGFTKVNEVGKTVISIRWEGGEGSELVGYNVYRSTKKGADFTLIGSTAVETYVDEDVKLGAKYFYTVSAVDSNFNETGRSNEISVDMPKPAEPKKAEEVIPPTKMRAAKFVMNIPHEKTAKEKEEAAGMTSEPVPGNAQGIVVDEAIGHIYVCSYEYGGVLVYDMQGKFQFGIRKDGVNGDQMFGACENVTLGPNGNIYVTDYTAPELYIFDYQGKPVGSLKVDISHVPGRKGIDATLYGVLVDKNGNIYVSDPRSNRIYGYNSKHERILEVVADEKKKDFAGTAWMAFDKNGDIVFLDSNHSRLMVVGKDGSFKRTIGKKGFEAGFLYYPVGIALGNAGEIFVASGITPNIQAFSDDGKFLYLLATEDFESPPPVGDMRGIYIDSKNRVYIADGRLNRVVVLQIMDSYKEGVPNK